MTHFWPPTVFLVLLYKLKYRKKYLSTVACYFSLLLNNTAHWFPADVENISRL